MTCRQQINSSNGALTIKTTGHPVRLSKNINPIGVNDLLGYSNNSKLKKSWREWFKKFLG